MLLPADCVLVGDNPDVDLRGVKAAGMCAAWVRDSWWEKPPEADAVFDEVPQLLPRLESWSRDG